MSRSYSGRLMSCHANVWHDIQTPPSGHAALKVFSFTLPSPFPRLCHLDSKPRSTANTARFKTYYCKPRGQLPSLLPFRAYQAVDVVSSLHAATPSSFMPQASSLQINSFKSLQASSPKQTEASHQTIYVLVLSSASFTPLFDVKPPQDSRYVRIALYVRRRRFILLRLLSSLLNILLLLFLHFLWPSWASLSSLMTMAPIGAMVLLVVSMMVYESGPTPSPPPLIDVGLLCRLFCLWWSLIDHRATSVFPDATSGTCPCGPSR
jgi:hypothetical protein